MRSLYVSQNGMAENLGQSQVLPYLRRLARRGVEIDLVSFELATLSVAARDEIRNELSKDGIRWHTLMRTMGASLPVKLFEAAKGAQLALKTSLLRRPDIVHGRSYFATAICDAVGGMTRRPKVLFDCRGMIGDEYVDCGYWTRDRLEYRIVKAYERQLFRRSDGIVVLTRALERWLRDYSFLGTKPIVEVVPCCVDMEKFRPMDEARIRLRRELGLGEAITIVYSGSLGTWYLEPEMARFAGALRTRLTAAGRRVAFVCLTPSDATRLRRALEDAAFPAEEIVVRKVPPAQMPEYLSVGDLGLSFIMSCFSKKGSSPTKVAEYLACGNVAVLNGDIGDQADLASEKDACVVLEDFGSLEIDRAVRQVADLLLRPRGVRIAACTQVARRHFGLEEVGIAKYMALYEALAGRKRSVA
jgi:glycosyltransferase involved in cell wall biosynthesis